MLAEVKVLIQGYTNADSVATGGEEKTCCSITLIKDNKNLILVDPGVLANQKILIDALKKENLTVNDINFVFLTHSHPDHYMNAGLFAKANQLEFYALWEGNVAKEWKQNFSENIEIIKTPGHEKTSLTFFVKTSKGIIAICGDVFWKENFPNPPKNDPYADEPNKLVESRKLILKKADYVIPGHGPMFKTNNSFLLQS